MCKSNNPILSIAMVISFLAFIPSSSSALEANSSALWFGGDEGIEIVDRTGVNLAYTKEDPKIDPRMTAHARKMDQALLKIGDKAYLAYGYALTSPMMMVGDDGIIIIDPPESLEAGLETLEAFRQVTDKPVRAIVYTHNHFDHVAAVKAFTTEEEVASGKVDIYAHETLDAGRHQLGQHSGADRGKTDFLHSRCLPTQGAGWVCP